MEIALIGNPNSGKTTLFNFLTGSNGTVGNWSGVTVEKKRGTLLSDGKTSVQDLPGVYSLFPYSDEERVVSDYFKNNSPDVIIDVIDATRLERSLYLAACLIELRLPLVIALNMCDVLQKRGDRIDSARLSAELGCPVVEISAVHGRGIDRLIAAAAEAKKPVNPLSFTGKNEEETAENRYIFVRDATARCFKKAKRASLSYVADKILTGRIFAFPVFIIIMAAVYSLSLGMPSRRAAEFISEGLFYDGWFVCGIGAGDYRADMQKFNDAQLIIGHYDSVFPSAAPAAVETDDGRKLYVTYADYIKAKTIKKPRPESYGPWVLGIIPACDIFFEKIGCSDIVSGLITNGILSGVGSVLSFLPQLLILFFCLAVLEDCGYMARIAFITDRLLSGFGMSGKSVIPMIIGTGCGVPGIMAARTIDGKTEKFITAATTTFMPCSAKLPLIALVTSNFFRRPAAAAICIYTICVISVLLSGVIITQIKGKNDRRPFIMELPDYHLPRLKTVFKSVKARVMAFIKKAATVIVLASGLIWFLSSFGINGGKICACDMQQSMLALAGRAICPLFYPLGWGDWRFTVAAITGLIAKENVVGTLGILIKDPLTSVIGGQAAFSFAMFNMLCTPCFAAVSAMIRELGGFFRALPALIYQLGFAYAASFVALRLTPPAMLVCGAATLVLLSFWKKHISK